MALDLCAWRKDLCDIGTFSDADSRKADGGRLTMMCYP